MPDGARARSIAADAATSRNSRSRGDVGVRRAPSGRRADRRELSSSYRAPMDGFEARALTHMLVVADARASRDWYVEVLNASVHGEYGGTSVVLDLLGNWLLLVTGGGPSPEKPTVTLVAPEHPDRVSGQIIFRVDDCHATYDLLRSRGAAFLTPPLDRGGEIRAFFRDPDGHLFEISQLT